MREWFSRLFHGPVEYSPRHQRAARVAPLDNPLDFRPDGTIRPGDPFYDTFLEILNSGESVVAHQQSDGSWDIEK